MRFLGPRFKPTEVARVLSAVEGTLERAAALSSLSDVTPGRRGRGRPEAILTHLAVGSSWEVETVYAIREGLAVAAPAATIVVNLPRIAGIISRVFRRLGEAHGWASEIISNDPDVLDTLTARDTEDSKLADVVERLWRLTLETTDGARIDLVDGRVRITVPPQSPAGHGRSRARLR